MARSTPISRKELQSCHQDSLSLAFACPAFLGHWVDLGAGVTGVVLSLSSVQGTSIGTEEDRGPLQP